MTRSVELIEDMFFGMYVDALVACLSSPLTMHIQLARCLVTPIVS
jgi:hypothetical protein